MKKIASTALVLASSALVAVPAFAQAAPASGTVDMAPAVTALKDGLGSGIIALFDAAPLLITFGIVYMIIKKFTAMARSGG